MSLTITLPDAATRVPLRTFPIHWHEAGTDSAAVDLEIYNGTGSDADPLLYASAAGLECKVGAGAWTALSDDPDSAMNLGTVSAGARLAIQVRVSLPGGSYRGYPLQLLLDLGI